MDELSRKVIDHPDGVRSSIINVRRTNSNEQSGSKISDDLAKVTKFTVFGQGSHVQPRLEDRGAEHIFGLRGHSNINNGMPMTSSLGCGTLGGNIICFRVHGLPRYALYEHRIWAACGVDFSRPWQTEVRPTGSKVRVRWRARFGGLAMPQ